MQLVISNSKNGSLIFYPYLIGLNLQRQSEKELYLLDQFKTYKCILL